MAPAYSSLSLSAPGPASMRWRAAPASDPQQASPVMLVRPLRDNPLEFSFGSLFVDNRSDRIESPRAWLSALPPLAAILHRLSLSAVSDVVCSERALQAILGGADTCAMDQRYGRTVLHWACLLARPVLVELLLQHGAAGHLNEPDAQGRSPLDCAQALRVESGAAAVVSLLLAAGASLDTLARRGVELLYLSDLDVVLAQRLLGAGVPVDGDDHAEHDGTPLIAACRHGLWPVASALLEAGADIRRRGLLRTSVLHHPDMPIWLAEQLLRRGADVNATDLLDTTPLMLACEEDHVPLARWLMDAGAATDGLSDEDLRIIDPAGARGDAPGTVRQAPAGGASRINGD